MPKKRKRPIYRKMLESYYKIFPDSTCIVVTNETLFHKAIISKNTLSELNENMKCCLKKEFIKSYRRARKEIRL